MIKINRPSCPNPTALQGNYKHPINKAALIAASFDKCMYCESKISHVYFGDVEHIKPKGKFSELEFDWDNLGYVCARCNSVKKDKYNASNPIINPYNENPEDHIIALGAVIAVKNNSGKGKVTIQESTGVHLNRPGLIERRLEKMKNIEMIIDICSHLEESNYKISILNELKKEGDINKEYSLCVKYLLKANGIN